MKRFMNYGIIIPAREEITILKPVLKAAVTQSRQPRQIILVDDGCDSDVESLCRLLGIEYYEFPVKHQESWAGRPELALVFNYGLEKLDPDLEWFMILGSDTVLSKEYAEKVIRGMISRNLVIASGRVIGEESNIPRGSGRIFAMWFWRNYIKRFPLIYAWESYPLYKALAEGYNIGVVEEGLMRILRPTRYYKPLYGYAMRELGYHPIYVLGKVIIAASEDLKTALGMLQSYIIGSGYRLEDKALKAFFKRYQLRRTMEYLKHPQDVLKRLRR